MANVPKAGEDLCVIKYEDCDEETIRKEQIEALGVEVHRVRGRQSSTWVGDLSSCGSSYLILDWFIWRLRGRSTINEKSTGECEYMLSARIVQDRERDLLYLDQSADLYGQILEAKITKTQIGSSKKITTKALLYEDDD